MSARCVPQHCVSVLFYLLVLLVQDIQEIHVKSEKEDMVSN